MIKIDVNFPKPRTSLVEALTKKFGDKDGIELAALMLDAWNSDRKDYVWGWIFPLHRQYFPVSWGLISKGLDNRDQGFTANRIKVMTISELLGESEDAIQSFLNSLTNDTH